MSNHIRTLCPGCGGRVKILAEDLGRRFRCNYCGHRFRIRPEAVLSSDSPSSWPPHPAVLSNGSREIEAGRAERDQSWEEERSARLELEPRPADTKRLGRTTAEVEEMRGDLSRRPEGFRGPAPARASASPVISREESESRVLEAERRLEVERARAAEREQFAEASRGWEEQVAAPRGEVESASPMAEAAHRQAGASARGPGNVLQEQFERLAELEGLVSSLRRDYEAALRDAEQRHRAEIARLHAAYATARQTPDASDRGEGGSIAVPEAVHGCRTHHES